MVLFENVVFEIQNIIPSINFINQVPTSNEIDEYNNIDIGSFVKKFDDKQQVLFIKDSDNEIKKYELQKYEKITNYEIGLINALLINLIKLAKESTNKKIFQKNINAAILNTICSFVNKITKSDKLNNKSKQDFFVDYEILVDIVEKLQSWIGKRNEGKIADFSFVIYENNDNIVSNARVDNVLYTNVIKDKFFERLTSSEFSSIRLDLNGNIIEHISKTQDDGQKTNWDAPIQLNGIISDVYMHNLDSSFLMVMLLKSNDILIIRNGTLEFAYRNSSWKSFNNTLMKELIFSKQPRLASSIYHALLDASFNYTGAGIAILEMSKNQLSDAQIQKIIELIDEDYILDYELHQKITDYKIKNDPDYSVDSDSNRRRTLRTLLGYDNNNTTIKVFQHGTRSISRQLLKECLSIDGSTVIDQNGVIIAVGAIIKKVTPGKGSGGRTAAAISSSTLGIGIKVSEDGEITGYKNSECIFVWG